MKSGRSTSRNGTLSRALVLMVEDLLRASDVQLEPPLEAFAYPARDALRARYEVGGDCDRDPASVRHDADPDGAGSRLGRDGGPLDDFNAAPCNRALRGTRYAGDSSFSI